MMYVLSETEFDNVVKDRKQLKRLPTEDALLEFCKEAANIMPVKEGWYAGKVWGCILTKTQRYCDDCPAREVCPHDYKEWSK